MGSAAQGHMTFEHHFQGAGWLKGTGSEGRGRGGQGVCVQILYTYPPVGHG